MWTKLFKWLAAPFAPYIVAALIVGLLGLSGFATWQYNRANDLSKSEARLTRDVEGLREEKKALAGALLRAAAELERYIDFAEGQYELLEADAVKRQKEADDAQAALNDANAVIDKLMESQDADVQRFLGPLPGAIADFLRGGGDEVPASGEGSASGRVGTARAPPSTRKTPDS